MKNGKDLDLWFSTEGHYCPQETCSNVWTHFFFFNLFLAVLGFCCCTQAFSSCGERGLPFVAVHGLLIAVASVVVEHGL